MPSVLTFINRFRRVATVRDWECQMFHISLLFQNFKLFTAPVSSLILLNLFHCLIVLYYNSSLSFFLHPRLLSDHYFTESFVPRLSLT